MFCFFKNIKQEVRPQNLYNFHQSLTSVISNLQGPAFQRIRYICHHFRELQKENIQREFSYQL